MVDARRAGVSKTAVYRRWLDRSRLGLDTLRERMTALTCVDTGCTLCDVHEVLSMTTAVFCDLGAGTLAQLLAEPSNDPSLHTELLQRPVDPVRPSVRQTLGLAHDRGDPRSTADLDLAADTLCALSFHQLLHKQRPLSESEIKQLVGGVPTGIAQYPEHLLRQYHTRSLDHLHREVD